jgi:pilus assembly protein CpaE
VIKPDKDNDFAIDFDADDDFMTTSRWDAESDAPTVDAPALGALAKAADADVGFGLDTDFENPSTSEFDTVAAPQIETDPFLTAPLSASVPPSQAAFPTPPELQAEAAPADDPFADLQPLPGATTEPARHVLEEAAFAPSTGEPMGAGLSGLATSGVAGEASAPRITIHIFCDRPETAQAAQAAAGDRRMSRATTVVQPGGLAGAVLHYQNPPTPSLIIVESGDPAPVLVGLLDQLAEVCDPGTKVIVIGRSNDIALYRELMKRGVSEYLVPPIQPLQIIQSITTLYSDPSAPFVGRTIAFVGAKGGVGASTIAHNFAHSLTEYMQTHAVIVDFDLPFGTAGLDFNQDPLQGVADALGQPDRLDPVLLDRMMVRCTERLSLFAAPATLDDDYDISADAFEEVASKIRGTAPFVILDLPHLWSGWMRRTLLGCEDVVIVATPDLASLRNAKNMIDVVRLARPNDQPPRLVLNQVGVPGRPEIPVKDFAAALGVEPSVVLNFDPKLFGQASNNGQMISETGPKSKATESLNLLAQIISRREPPPTAKKSFLASLLKK